MNKEISKQEKLRDANIKTSKTLASEAKEYINKAKTAKDQMTYNQYMNAAGSKAWASAEVNKWAQTNSAYIKAGKKVLSKIQNDELKAGKDFIVQTDYNLLTSSIDSIGFDPLKEQKIVFNKS
jgi:hypothetical protein